MIFSPYRPCLLSLPYLRLTVELSGYSEKTAQSLQKFVNFNMSAKSHVKSYCKSPISSPCKAPRIEKEKRPVLQVMKLSDNAHLPTRGSKFSAGLDLRSAYDEIVPKRGSRLIKTDLKIVLPHDTYGRVAPRSGLALRNKIDVGAGVIDEDYRGPLGIILFNHGDEDFEVKKGDRIAQLITEKIEYPDVREVEELSETERGENGFGSTGVSN